MSEMVLGPTRVARSPLRCAAKGCEDDPIQRGETYRVVGREPYHLECAIYAESEGPTAQEKAEDSFYDGLTFHGVSHTLEAMWVDGDRWCGMIVVHSAADAAMVMPDEARQLAAWLIEAADRTEGKA